MIHIHDLSDADRNAVHTAAEAPLTWTWSEIIALIVIAGLVLVAVAMGWAM